MKSGKYVHVASFKEFSSLAKRFGLSVKELKNMNPEFTSGPQWVFVPMGAALLENYRNFTFSGIDLLWPVPASNTISSEFGERWGKNHEGIDIPAKTGSSILAAEDGVVIFSGNSLKSYGKMAIIKHLDGFFTVYAHASKLHVKKGEKVSRGQVIARVGSTGRSTGPHLHFELRKDTRALNPQTYITKAP